jgi:hypothetical protein
LYLQIFSHEKPGTLAQDRDIWLCLGVLCLKSQNTSSKKQTSSKLQAPHQKDGGQANLKEIPKFVILNFGYCDLFVI